MKLLIDKMKHLKENKKEFRLIIFAIIIIISILYLKTFFAKGVYINDVFLKKQSISDEIHYVGKDIKVVVKGKGDISQKSSAEVILISSEGRSRAHKVNFNGGDEWSVGKVEVIDESERVLFDGNYRKGGMFLYDKNIKPVTEDITVYLDLEHQIPLKNIVEFACHDNETIRGEPGFLAIAVILLIITIIDIKYPLFFFNLSHHLSVKDPEPTEFYVDMQRLSWFIYSIIILILLIVAI